MTQANEEVSIVTPPQTLKNKVQGATKSILNEQKQRAAQTSMTRNAGEFKREVESHLLHLQALYCKDGINAEDAEKMLESTFAIKSCAGMVDYPLASAVAKSMYVFLEGQEEIHGKQLKVVKAHTDALRGIFHNQFTGDGGELGMELQESLAVVIEKFSD